MWRKFWAWLFHRVRLNREIIVFDARGCQAQDWTERYRGRVITVGWRSIYGGRQQRYKFYRVRLADGTEEEVPALHVLEGTAEMQKRTNNPEETLIGKLVLVK